MKISALLIAITLAMTACLADAQEKTDVGLAVGARAPGFSLVDQHGETRTLDSLLEKGRTALLFYRSADW